MHHHLREGKLSSERLLDGVLLEVYRDRVRLPDGNEAIREWIDHPGASAVVPLFSDGSTLLVRQFRYPCGQVFLEIPAGRLDEHGEDPAATAARELEEETGWQAGSLTKLGAFFPCIGYSNEIIHVYLAENLVRGEQNLESGEFIELVPMAFSEAVDLVRAGEIVDMKSAFALLYVQQFVEQREGEVASDRSTRAFGASQ